MATDTTLSIIQIELGLARYFNFRNNVIVPNVSWGLLNHEADLLILSKSGYLTEIEIKRSWADFLADFRKRHTHEDTKVSWHYYAVPVSIVDKCRAKLAEVDPSHKWGLISYTASWDGECWPKIESHPSNIHYHCSERKLYLVEQFQLARLGAMRTWTLKEKIINNEK